MNSVFSVRVRVTLCKHRISDGGHVRNGYISLQRLVFHSRETHENLTNPHFSSKFCIFIANFVNHLVLEDIENLGSENGGSLRSVIRERGKIIFRLQIVQPELILLYSSN